MTCIAIYHPVIFPQHCRLTKSGHGATIIYEERENPEGTHVSTQHITPHDE